MSSNNNNTHIQVGQIPETNPAIEIARQIGNKQAPSNQQIDSLIDTTQHFVEQRKNDPRADPTSVKIVSDFEQVLEATQQLNKNKNFDESLQSIVMETASAAKDMGQQGKEIHSGQAGEMAKLHGQKLKDHTMNLTSCVWDVLKLMIKSGEFRSHVATLLGVIQEVLSVSQDKLENNSQTQHMPSTTTTTTTHTSEAMTASHAPSHSSETHVSPSTKLSEEKRNQLVSSLLSVMRKFNEQPQFKEGLREISHIFEELQQQQKENPNMSTSTIKEAVGSNEHMDTAFEKSKTMVERFSKRPIDPLLEKNRNLFTYVRNHEQARQWLKELGQVLRDGLAKPEELDDQEFRKRLDKLIDQAHELSKDQELRLKYSELTTELRSIFNSIRDDEDLRRLQLSTARFLDNFMTTDADGRKHFNPDFVQQLRHFLIPLIVAQLDNIPIPPIDGSNDDYDFHVDSMTLRGKEVMPDMIEIHTRSDLSLKLRDVNRSDNQSSRTSAEIVVSNIRVNLDQFHFKFDKKTFPKLSDEGIASVRVEGNSGATLRLRVELSMVNGAPHIHLTRVDFDVERLKIDIVDAKHDILLKMFSTLYQTRAKRTIEQKTEEKIREIFQRLEGGMNDLFARYPPSKIKEVLSSSSSSDKKDSSSQHPALAQHEAHHALQS